MSSRVVQGNSYFAQVALGNVANRTDVFKFGRNESISATPAIVATGGVYGRPTTADTVAVTSSSPASDNPSGAGARLVMVQGLDSNFKRIEELVFLGTTSIKEFIRVYRVYVVETGNTNLFTGGNVGTLSVTQTAGTVMIQVAPLKNQTLCCAYTIPAGFRGLVWAAEASTGEGKSAIITLYARIATDTNAPYRVQGERDSYQNTVDQEFVMPRVIQPKTDIILTAESAAAGTSVSGTLIIELDKVFGNDNS